MNWDFSGGNYLGVIWVILQYSGSVAQHHKWVEVGRCPALLRGHQLGGSREQVHAGLTGHKTEPTTTQRDLLSFSQGWINLNHTSASHSQLSLDFDDIFIWYLKE